MHTEQSPCPNAKHSLKIIMMQQSASAPSLYRKVNIRSIGVSTPIKLDENECGHLSVENTFYSVEAISVRNEDFH